MELRDYGSALRRFWPTWVGMALAGALAALGVVLAAAPTYSATAEVFVTSTSSSTSGWQVLNQRVPSYPDIASSHEVLEPVIHELHLASSFAGLASRLSAINPAGTSQIQITVSDSDARRAAAIANAVAKRFGSVVVSLEKPPGGMSPVNLTVTTPATPSSAPSFPVPSMLLSLGAAIGLLLGVATAILRGSRDTRLFTEEDIRAAWGPDSQGLTVHAPTRRTRRSRHSPLAARPATLLARQLVPLVEDHPVRVMILSPTQKQRAARSLADDVASQLERWEVPVRRLDAAPAEGLRPTWPGVDVVLGTPVSALPEWRGIGRTGTHVVVVVEPGRADRADLQELRSIFTASGIRALAVVLHPRSRGRRRPAAAGRAPEQSPVGVDLPAEPLPAAHG